MTRSCGTSRIRKPFAAVDWTHLGCSFDDPFCDLRLASNANGVVVANDRDELVLVHGLLVVVDAEPLGLKGLDGLLVDVLEDEEPEVIVVNRVQDLGLADCARLERLLAHLVPVGEGGGGRGYADLGEGRRAASGNIYGVRHDGCPLEVKRVSGEERGGMRPS
jgi:hypothetical protein